MMKSMKSCPPPALRWSRVPFRFCPFIRERKVLMSLLEWCSILYEKTRRMERNDTGCIAKNWVGSGSFSVAPPAGGIDGAAFQCERPDHRRSATQRRSTPMLNIKYQHEGHPNYSLALKGAPSDRTQPSLRQTCHTMRWNGECRHPT